MSEKVKVSREIADVLSLLRSNRITNEEIISNVVRGVNYDAENKLRGYFEDSFDDLLQALVNGYEVENTPKDKVREYYEQAISRIGANAPNGAITEAFGEGQMQAIHFVLNTLGIEIDGIPLGYKKGADNE